MNALNAENLAGADTQFFEVEKMSFFLAIKTDAAGEMIHPDIRLLHAHDCQSYVRRAVQNFFGTEVGISMVTSDGDGDTCQQLVEDATQVFAYSKPFIETTPGQVFHSLFALGCSFCFWYATDVGFEFRHIVFLEKEDAFCKQFLKQIQRLDVETLKVDISDATKMWANGLNEGGLNGINPSERLNGDNPENNE